MANPKGNEASLRDSRFKAAWQSGSTRTIRVPVALADATLEYARQLDSGKPHGTSDLNDEVQQLKDEVEQLQNELSNLRMQVAAPIPKIELLEAADLLNRLKAKRKKSKTELLDVEKILEIIRG